MISFRCMTHIHSGELEGQSRGLISLLQASVSICSFFPSCELWSMRVQNFLKRRLCKTTFITDKHTKYANSNRSITTVCQLIVSDVWVRLCRCGLRCEGLSLRDLWKPIIGKQHILLPIVLSPHAGANEEVIVSGALIYLCIAWW